MRMQLSAKRFKVASMCYHVFVRCLPVEHRGQLNPLLWARKTLGGRHWRRLVNTSGTSQSSQAHLARAGALPQLPRRTTSSRCVIRSRTFTRVRALVAGGTGQVQALAMGFTGQCGAGEPAFWICKTIVFAAEIAKLACQNRLHD